MRDLLETLEAWRAEGTAAGRAVVVRTFGSAPRPEGAVLLVADDGRLMGSVSGGCVEGAAAEEIERARRSGNARVIRYGISDEEAWDVGLACGGTIDVLVQPSVPGGGDGRRRRIGRSARQIRGRRHRRSLRTRRRRSSDRTSRARERPPSRRSWSGQPASSSRVPPAIVRGTRRSVRPRHGSSMTGDPGRSRSAAEPSSSRPFQSARGSSSSGPWKSPGRSSRYARELGYETVVVDGRAAFATRERFPDVDADRCRLAGRGVRDARRRAERRRGDPVSRPEVRRAGDRRGDAPGLPVRRGGRVPEDAAGPARAPSRGRPDGRRA